MSKAPPIPSGNKNTKVPAGARHPSHPEGSPHEAKDHKHHNAAEQGQTANIKQNKTNAGFFKGRRTK